MSSSCSKGSGVVDVSGAESLGEYNSATGINSGSVLWALARALASLAAFAAFLSDGVFGSVKEFAERGPRFSTCALALATSASLDLLGIIFYYIKFVKKSQSSSDEKNAIMISNNERVNK